MSSDAKRTRTVLVVEDEDIIRVLAEKFLADAGYKVLAADSGTAGVRASDEFAGPIDLLVTDLMMPGMTGWEVARVLRAKRPELRVLFMTGFAGGDHAEETPIIPPDELLAKPFRFPDFIAIVQRLLA